MTTSKLEQNAEEKICPYVFNGNKCYRERKEQPPVCITGHYSDCTDYQLLAKPNPNMEIGDKK